MNTQSASKTILVVDDEPSVRSALSLLLNCGGYEVEAAASGEDALARLQRTRFDLLLTDNFMPGMSGVDLASASKATSPSLPVVMFTAYPPAKPHPFLDLVLTKPGAASSLLESVGRLCQAAPA
jgi:two-component system, response regulator FlrC